MIWVVHPGSGSRIQILIFYPSRIQGAKWHQIPDPGPGSATLKNVNCDVFPECMTDNAGSGRLLTPKISRVISLVHLSSVSATERQRIINLFKSIALLFQGKVN
jgi:hypothetical protein